MFDSSLENDYVGAILLLRQIFNPILDVGFERTGKKDEHERVKRGA
jgi:hypothetical protein